MRSEIYICDECGAQKRSANHWWMICNMGEDADCDVRGIQLADWDDKTASEPLTTHYCGRDCATRAISRYMDSGTVEIRGHAHDQADGVFEREL